MTCETQNICERNHSSNFLRFRSCFVRLWWRLLLIPSCSACHPPTTGLWITRKNKKKEVGLPILCCHVDGSSSQEECLLDILGPPSCNVIWQKALLIARKSRSDSLLWLGIDRKPACLFLWTDVLPRKRWKCVNRGYIFVTFWQQPPPSFCRGTRKRLFIKNALTRPCQVDGHSWHRRWLTQKLGGSKSSGG